MCDERRESACVRVCVCVRVCECVCVCECVSERGKDIKWAIMVCACGSVCVHVCAGERNKDKMDNMHLCVSDMEMVKEKKERERERKRDRKRVLILTISFRWVPTPFVFRISKNGFLLFATRSCAFEWPRGHNPNKWPLLGIPFLDRD